MWKVFSVNHMFTMILSKNHGVLWTSKAMSGLARAKLSHFYSILVSMSSHQVFMFVWYLVMLFIICFSTWSWWRQVSIEEGDAKSREFGVMFIETSAKAGFNIKVGFWGSIWEFFICIHDRVGVCCNIYADEIIPIHTQTHGLCSFVNGDFGCSSICMMLTCVTWRRINELRLSKLSSTHF